MEPWQLRWRFEYLDGTAKYGQWDRHGDFETDQAWRQDKQNLLYACIEGRERTTKTYKVIHRCLGGDFVNFSWIATSTVPLGLKGSVTPIPRIIGLILVDRDKNHSAFRNGGVRSEAHGRDYGVEHLASFGR